MTGWEKVAAATLVAVIGLLGLNLAIWRRMRAAVASGVQIENEQQGQAQPLEVERIERSDHSADVRQANRR